MKQRFSTLSIIVIFAVMLAFPKAVFSGATDGLLLWFQIVLPTLLPFIIISNIMIHTNAITYIARFLGPLLQPLLGVSSYGSFAVLAGFLCGYPMGGKVTADLIRTDRISLIEGKYLLSFCNNTSPMFIISFVLWQNLQHTALTIPSLVILMLSPILCSFMFRSFYKPNGKAAIHQNTMFCKDGLPGQSDSFTPKLLDSCMMDSFESIVKVGGYIMLFSILLKLIQSLSLTQTLFTHILLPMLEITNGIPMLCELSVPFNVKYVLVMGLTSFGGLCAAAQTNCLIQGTGLTTFPYIIQKLITMMVTSLLAYTYIYFY